METHWKWVSRVAPRPSRRGHGSYPIDKVRRAVRPLWLDKEAVQAAEPYADSAGVSVTRYIESMLFEICGASPPVRKSARRVRRPEAPLAQVIRIDRQAKR